MQEKLIESCEASRVRRNTFYIVEDEELVKRKKSRIPRITRIMNTPSVGSPRVA